ncbi:MAG TPA: DUF190 domain-containing protein [Micromonosporaceae bacterium]
MTDPLGPALRLTIFVGEYDQSNHESVYEQAVRRAHDCGLATVSVLHGIEGYGAHSRIHTQRILSLTEDLPVVVVIVDVEQRIREFLPWLDGVVAEGLVVIDRVLLSRA